MSEPPCLGRTLKLAIGLLTGSALFAAAGAAGAEAGPTVDELLGKHLEARGGAERWEAVRSLEMRGTWSAFSETAPVTISRMRPDFYRLDGTLIGEPVTLAHDGERPWVLGAALGATEPQEIEDSWRRNVLEDARFGSLLLDHAANGAAIESLGTDEVEGRDVHVLKVSPRDAPEETWYLDAGTFLEVKRVSTTIDVFGGGIEVEMATFYMDFREVGGVTIPHREERHFGTRYHVYEIAEIVLDPGWSVERFRMPPPGEKGDPAADGS